MRPPPLTSRPLSPSPFIFMQHLANILQNNRLAHPLGSWPPLWEILDPPLETMMMSNNQVYMWSISRTENTLRTRMHSSEQECIPVGCIPPTAVAICCGVSASVHGGIHTPLDLGLEIPLGVGLGTSQVWAWRLPLVWAWRPPLARPLNFPLGCGPEDPPPCEQNSWHTLLKILPCPNFVAGGNKMSSPK